MITITTTIASLSDPRIRRRADGKFEIDAQDGGSKPHIFDYWIHAMDALQASLRNRAAGAQR